MKPRSEMSAHAAGETRFGVSLDQEFALAATCCRWPPAHSRNLAVRRCASGGVDWQVLAQVARLRGRSAINPKNRRGDKAVGRTSQDVLPYAIYCCPMAGRVNAPSTVLPLSRLVP
jgi:hypothetical protein